MGVKIEQPNEVLVINSTNGSFAATESPFVLVIEQSGQTESTSVVSSSSVVISSSGNPIVAVESTSIVLGLNEGIAGVGVPTGGTTGQVLKKASNANYDTVWANGSGGGVESVTGGTNITVDNTDPANPAVSTINNPAFSTSVTTPIVKASSSAGGELRTNNDTVVLHYGSGGGANGTLYGGWNYDNGTANTLLSLGASKTLTSLNTATYPSLTEISYVKGVTSSIQTQLNGKQPALGYTPENAGNKENTTIDTDTTKYPTVNLLKTGLDNKVDKNSAITGATKTKITYDAKGLVTAGADATTADIASSVDKRYVTDAQLTVIENTSGTNTGDQNLFSTIAVSGQSNVIADSTSDTLTLANGTGIAITTNATTDTITITNTAPDQTVALTSGTGISVTGTYPNFTVTNTSPSSGGTVTSVAALTLGTTGTDLSSSVANGTTTPVITLNVPTASASSRGALSSADWSTFNGKQAQLNGTGFVKATGTTITYDNSTYLTAAITSLGGLTAATQTFATGSAGTAPAFTSATSTHTLNIPLASTIGVTSGTISKADYDTFNSKENALTFSTGLTRSINTITVNTTQNIAKLSNLTGNGFVKTSGGDGTLSIDTNTYLTGNQTITLSGEVSGSGATAITTTVSNAAVIGKVLTGFTAGAGTVAATDTILQAFQKVVGNIAALVTGVSSVFGRTGTVVATSGDYNTSQVTENTNLYFTDERAQDAVGSILVDSSELDFTYNDATPSITASIVASSIASGKLDAGVNTSLGLANTAVQPARTISTTAPLSGGGDLSANRTLSIADAAADGTTKGAATFTASDFNATGGVVSIDYTNGQAATTSQKGFLTSADWNTFNGKQSAITFGTGVQTALGVNIGTAGSVVVNGGALGTPSSGVATNLTGTASGLTAGTVTTNANLTGVVTSVGNATSIADAALSIAKTSGLQTALDSKQASLVSGTNIKTINGSSILGTGDLAIDVGANTTLSNLGTTAINTSLLLGTSDGGALGSTTKMWSDLFLASGGVINWNNGDVVLTHSLNSLKLTGGDFRLGSGSQELTLDGAGSWSFFDGTTQQYAISPSNVTFGTTDADNSFNSFVLQSGSTNTEAFKWDSSNGVVINGQQTTFTDFRVKTTGLTHALFVDASANAIGINNSSPSANLSITGSLTYALSVTGRTQLIGALNNAPVLDVSRAMASGAMVTLTGASGLGDASGTTYMLNSARSGTNANANHLSYGLYSTVTNTGTSSYNIAGYFSASGGSVNIAGHFDQGIVSIGVARGAVNLGVPLNIKAGGLQISDSPIDALGTYLNTSLYFNGDTDQTYYAQTYAESSKGDTGTSWSINCDTGIRYTGTLGTMQINGGDYLNFSTTLGTTGYGLRNNAGVVEGKNSGGAWSPLICSDTAYASSWNGVTTQAPSKNAVYDEMELRQKGGSEVLAANFNTASTTAVSTNLTFAIAANEIYTVVIEGTASKATTATGMKLAIAAPTGCTIKGEAYLGGATLAAAPVPSLISAINTLGTTFATGIGVEVTFRMTFRVVNGVNAGSITLQGATVTSNTATIYAGTRMTYTKAISV